MTLGATGGGGWSYPDIILTMPSDWGPELWPLITEQVTPRPEGKGLAMLYNQVTSVVGDCFLGAQHSPSVLSESGLAWGTTHSTLNMGSLFGVASFSPSASPC